MLDRRQAFTLALAAGLAPAVARAQAWRPSRPIRLVVPFAPGGSNDIVSRLIAEPASQLLGQPIVIESRAGAGSVVGSEHVARAAADGYTLLINSAHATVPAIVERMPYDPVEDFVGLAVAGFSPHTLVVNPRFPAQTAQEMVALLRANPGRYNLASAGLGSGVHLAAELLNLRLSARMTHVPFRGTAPVLTELMAGRVDIFFSDTSAWPMVQQGRLRLLAVSTAARWSIAPEVPAVNDLVRDFDIANWYGVIAPPGTPEAPRQRLFEEIQRIVAKPEVMEFLVRIGFEPAPLPASEFTAFLRAETQTWRAVVQAANIRAD
jgi:tripartite-type tricarboxylate transporter receptor subunit TctC